MAIGLPLEAEDLNPGKLTYTLTNTPGGVGYDADHFDIDRGTGQLMTKGKLDSDANGVASYEVTVRVTDPSGDPGAGPVVPANSDTVVVNITVTNLAEAPIISISKVGGDSIADVAEKTVTTMTVATSRDL